MISNDNEYLQDFDRDCVAADIDDYDFFGEIMEGDEDNGHTMDDIELNY